jgi:hypothetical protein
LPTANSCCGFGEGTFASTHGNGQDAPKAAICPGWIEPAEVGSNRPIPNAKISVRGPIGFARNLAVVAGNAQQTVSDGLGTVHFSISCTAVQAKFERAVALLHNFHYPETVNAFQAVIPDW